MLRWLRALLLGILVAGVATCAAADDAPLKEARQLEAAVQAAIARAEPSIACILVRRERERPADFARKPTDLDDRNAAPDFFGSGVVLDGRQGLILTHYHVVRKARQIAVRLPRGPGEEGVIHANASIYAADSRCDLAVLKVDRVVNVPSIALGDGERLKKGSFVIALGYPYAVGFRDGSANASWGMITNLRRRPPGVTNEIDRTRLFTNLGVLLQTDARLQLGSSGGALIDLDGKLVGLTTAQAALTGVDAPGGFAIPIDANYRRIIDVLSRGEEVEYGFLGVTTSPNQNQLVERTGSSVFFINGVTPNSPADHAGLRTGDAILSVNGQRVREYDDLFFYLGAALAGRRTELLIQHRGDWQPQKVTVTLVKYPLDSDREASRVTHSRPAIYGLRVDYTSIIAKTGEPLAEGVVVRDVQANSPAKAANLTEFVDIITEINDMAVNSPAEFYREAEKAMKNGDKVRLTLRNPARSITLP